MLDLKIALVQANLEWKDKRANFLKFEEFLQSQKEKPDIIILPEMFATGFVTEPADMAEDMSGETVSWLVAQAKTYNCAITGSVIIKENNDYYNRLVWVQHTGEIFTYDKRHLFTYGNEHAQYKAGSERLIVDVLGWKVCPLICYDLRFPVWSKNTFADGVYGYDLLLYIANWPTARSFAFRQLLVARAIENQCYVAGVNRVGIDGNGVYHQGDSCVLDFKGNHLAEMKPDTEGIAYVNLNYEQLKQARDGFPVGADWDIYKIQ